MTEKGTETWSGRVYVFSVDKKWWRYVLMVKVINPFTESVDYYGPAESQHLPTFFKQLGTQTIPDAPMRNSAP